MYSPSSGTLKNSPGMHPRNNASPNMYSPRNNESQSYNSQVNNASPRMFSPRNDSPQNFNSQRNNTSYGTYSPNNSFQGMHSPQSSPHGMCSSLNNTSQRIFSPRSTSQVMYSHRSSLPMRHNWHHKPSIRSRNSSGFNSCNLSFDSNESFSPRGKPYDRRNKKFQGGHYEQPYNIQSYLNSSMLEDPWADLKSVEEDKKCEGSQS